MIVSLFTKRSCNRQSLLEILGIFIFVIATLVSANGRIAKAETPDITSIQQGQTFRECPECPEMVVIPAGTFSMGSSEEQSAEDVKNAPWGGAWLIKKNAAYQHPQHSVTIPKPFALGKYPITRAQFAAFISETHYVPENGCMLVINHKYPFISGVGWQNPGFPQSDKDPVVCVSISDVRAYIGWLNSKIGDRLSQNPNGPYRLPTEAEWEYSARAGTQTPRWWGDSVGTDNVNCDGCGAQWIKGTTPVDKYRSNPFGLYDMLGNIFEWTEDCWSPNYVGAPKNGSSFSVASCDQRALRGSSWNSDPWSHTSANRTYYPDTMRVSMSGFRLLKDIY